MTRTKKDGSRRGSLWRSILIYPTGTDASALQPAFATVDCFGILDQQPFAHIFSMFALGYCPWVFRTVEDVAIVEIVALALVLHDVKLN